MDCLPLRPLSWKIRLGYFIPLLAMGSLPLIWFHYAKAERYALDRNGKAYGDVLIILLLILVAIQFLFSIRTAVATVIVTKSTLMGDDGEPRMLTAIEWQKRPWGIWWSVVRHHWPDYLLLMGPRLEMALAFAYFFHFSGMMAESSSIVYQLYHQFYYVSHDGVSIPIVYPHYLQGLIVLPLLVVYALGELGLAAALGLLWGTLTKEKRMVSIVGRVGVARFLLVVAAALTVAFLGLILRIHNFDTAQKVQHSYNLTRLCSKGDLSHLTDSHQQYIQDQGGCESIIEEGLALLAIDSTKITMISLADQGVLLSANILRPTVHPDKEVPRNTAYQQTLRDRLPFIVRNVLSAMLALCIYGALIWGLLYVTQVGLRRGFD